MADNYTTCGNYFTWDTILMALIDDVSTLALSREHTGFRVVDEGVGTRPTTALSCTSKDDFMQLIRQCLCVADDSRMALRVCYVLHSNGLGLSPMECGTGQDYWQRLAKLFVYTESGTLAVYIASIT